MISLEAEVATRDPRASESARILSFVIAFFFFGWNFLFNTMSSKVVYEGWMVRYGRRKIGRSFIHMRYFVLESRLLAYYKRKPQDNQVFLFCFYKKEFLASVAFGILSLQKLL